MLRIGHRGASAYAPENTLSSFAKAMDLGVDMIELDVRLCLSGELVVIHDRRLDRTTNGSGRVEEQTLDQLQKLDAGNGEKIPTLEDVFDLVDRRTKINIELKGRQTALPTARIIELYVKEYGWSYDDFFVSSSDHHELYVFNQALSEVGIGAIIDALLIDMTKYAQNLGADAVVSFDVLVPSLVEDAHDRSLRIFVYTVNEPDDITWVKSLGVDGIFSDYPDRL